VIDLPHRPRDGGWEQDHAQRLICPTAPETGAGSRTMPSDWSAPLPPGRGLGERRMSSQVYYSQTLRLYKSAKLLYNARGTVYQLEGLGIGQ
jgi:hypothetical protein